MSKPLLITLDGNFLLREGLLRSGLFEAGDCDVRHFPDGESYVRVRSGCAGRDVIVQCGLQNPDHIILSLLFCADTLRELGAHSVGLLAPYLAYMRQDCRFQDGEAISSRLFARLISAHFDWLITVDPHLHRFHSLTEIYSIPSQALKAAPLLANWIAKNIDLPLLIGPDSESEQWVSAVAQLAGTPFIVLEKTRHGDRDVNVTVPNVERWRSHTPVLVDDIISTGQTMLETIAHLRATGMASPVCIGVHGLFAESADKKLMSSGASGVVTTNSISHESNGIDLSDAIVDAIAAVLDFRTDD